MTDDEKGAVAPLPPAIPAEASPSLEPGEKALLNHLQRQVRDGLTTWLPPEDQPALLEALTCAFNGIGPKDATEAMLASQMVACHNAAMTCLHRAALAGQPMHARQTNLALAAKLMRTFTLSMEALDRHRGKGQQKVTVEHVHVHQGGQAIVGDVHTGGSTKP